jgi:hypothetical protein
MDSPSSGSVYVPAATWFAFQLSPLMSLVKTVLVLAIGTAGVKGGMHVYAEREAAEQRARPFVAMPEITGLEYNAITIVAAENCPKEDAQRADALAASLSERGFPVARASHIEGSAPASQEAADRLNAVMAKGPLPIVFVRGYAKNNPGRDEVIAEYRGQ